jgi:Ser/Thr protein kinase RdoA (MazF antagonist)
MISNEELVSILNKYSLGELSSSIEQLTDGWTNLTYKFQIKSNKKNFILREYLPNTQRIIILEDIQFECHFISYLFKHYHLPVVSMIDPPGIFSLNNGHYAIILPFINGIKYVNTPKNSTRQFWQTIEISRFLGRMHSIDQENISSRFNRRTINLANIKYQLVHSCDEFENAYPDLYQRIRRIIDEHTNLIPLIENELEQIKFEKDLEKNLPKGFIHVDIHDENVLFSHDQNKIAAVLDFDDMSFGPFIIDIAMTLCFSCSVGSEFRVDYAKQFLIQYENARNMLLTNDEWNLLELYCYMTMLHQILFTIQLPDSRGMMNDMIEELIHSIEQISQDKIFLKIKDEQKSRDNVQSTISC